MFATGHARPPAPAVLDLDRVRAHTLPNGLRVRLLPDAQHARRSATTRSSRSAPATSGSATTGISHLFEHMMFNGAARYGPKEFDRVLEARGGHSNAYTSNDVTAYYEDFAAEALETVVDLESDRMRSLRLTDESLEQEREVVKEERRLRTENSIFGLMEEQLEALVFLAHPYRWPVIGWMDDIERITRDDCEAFFRTYYAPNNAPIYVVGDLDPDATLALLERLLRRHPRRPAPRRRSRPASRRSAASGAPIVRYPAQAPAILAGWRGPAARSPDSSALDVLQVCLAVGESSRLRRKLVQETELAVSVSISWGWRIDPGVFLAFVELAPGVPVERAEALLWEEIAKVAARGVSRRGGARARRRCCAARSCTSSRRTTASRTRSARPRRSSATGARPGARSSTTPR